MVLELHDLQASCSLFNKLVDHTGKEMYFYHLQKGTESGNVTDNLNPLDKTNISQLQKAYSVVILACK